MNDLVYWIWLSQAVTAGTEAFGKLINKFSSPREIYEANDADIAACIGSRSRDISALSDKNLSSAEKILGFCMSKNIGILTYSDEKFPNALRKISNPPVLLYYRGVLPDFNSECLISVVGTRRLTDYGRKNAFEIGSDLAKAGAVIVSGMAIGIDGVAMAGALSSGGVTVAFLGSGIDVCYPEVHQTLARAIVKNGCVMTEYCPGTKPDGYNFPRRNRLISGISSAAIVIEGKERSGSLITARCAKMQGKALYALPGNVDNETSEVTNLLIKNGAKLITSAYDIVADFEYTYLGKINPFAMAQKSNVKMMDALSEYKVSCVTHSDKVFFSSSGRSARSARKETSENDVRETQDARNDSKKAESITPEAAGFDKSAIEIYRKIPLEGEIAINALVDGENTLRDVMRALFKLDVGKFIVMLPGEKVKRKL